MNYFLTIWIKPRCNNTVVSNPWIWPWGCPESPWTKRNLNIFTRFQSNELIFFLNRVKKTFLMRSGYSFIDFSNKMLIYNALVRNEMPFFLQTITKTSFNRTTMPFSSVILFADFFYFLMQFRNCSVEQWKKFDRNQIWWISNLFRFGFIVLQRNNN